MTSAREPDPDGGAPSGRTPGPGTPPDGGRVVTIRCRQDGPLVIDPAAAGDCTVRVIDHLGAEFRQISPKKGVALCRCGQSGTRPFCDGSHRAAGFRAGETA